MRGKALRGPAARVNRLVKLVPTGRDRCSRNNQRQQSRVASLCETFDGFMADALARCVPPEPHKTLAQSVAMIATERSGRSEHDPRRRFRQIGVEE